MKKKRILIIIILILLLLIILLLPTIKNAFNPETPSSPYAEFGSFIPYTMGYFPENFMILTVGTDLVHEADMDQFEEWYRSDNHIIKIIQSEGERVDIWRKDFVANLSRLVQGQKVELKNLEDPQNFLGEEFVLNNSNNNEFWLVTFFIDDLRIQIISNLPGEEIMLVAENLVPSICLNPTKESS